MSVDFKFSDVVSGNSGSCFRQSRVVGMLVAYVLAPKSEPSSTSGFISISMLAYKSLIGEVSSLSIIRIVLLKSHGR
ncbi:unnamed protein product [Prunus armeniaca]|uniref:Uncharacterized protein n=1 Tax=Prunus armeniaca TaxID=36596 RepID=A0A6J5Y2J8_PRUAR|nr:unnamed protein product [Prunus armeniaca]